MKTISLLVATLALTAQLAFGQVCLNLAPFDDFTRFLPQQPVAGFYLLPGNWISLGNYNMPFYGTGGLAPDGITVSLSFTANNPTQFFDENTICNFQGNVRVDSFTGNWSATCTNSEFEPFYVFGTFVGIPCADAEAVALSTQALHYYYGTTSAAGATRR